MKIVQVHNAYQQPGGEDVVVASERALLERHGHTVIPYLRSNSELLDASLLDRLAILPKMTWSSDSRRDFATILDREQPDLVHVHNTFMVISPSIYSACAERGIPLVQTLHNFRLLCPGAELHRGGAVCEECLDHGLLRSIRHACYRDSRGATAAVASMLVVHDKLNTWRDHVSRFIALTAFARDKFVAAGFPGDKFAVKPNFLDPDPGQRTETGDYALFVGRLAENKGLDVLLDAWAIHGAHLPLHIVGDGPERTRLEARVRNEKLSGVTFRGRLAHHDAVEALKHARFLIVPSTWYETFGMCIIESFACGTPVICSRLGAMQELVTDGRTGQHFTAGDARDLAEKIRWAWTHPDETAAMGRNARTEYQARFTAEQNYSLLMEVYEQSVAAYA